MDHIPDAHVAAARKIQRSLVDPVQLASMTAPGDDAPETEEELAEIERVLSDPRSDRDYRVRTRVLKDGTIRIAQVKHRREACR